MAKTLSKKSSNVRELASCKSQKLKSREKNLKVQKTSKTSPSQKTHFWQKWFSGVKTSVQKLQKKWREFRKGKVKLHHSFKRSYREDYQRETKAPGLLSHAMTTFQVVFKHWKTFIPLIAIMLVAYIILVGLLSEDLYMQFQATIDETSAELAQGEIGNFAKAGLLLISSITTGGLDTGMGEAQMVFMIFLFLVMWLVTIYLLRHFMAGGKPKLRDGLYNALAPLIPTLLIFVVIFIQLIPLMLVMITYSAAVTTGFLSTPFYALVYFLFAAVMVLITLYLLSSSLMALVAVSAPGMYPMKALFAASDLMAGRRTKLIIRVIYLLIVAGLIYAVVMTPIILLDLLLKSAWDWMYGIPVVPFCLLAVTCFVFVYATAYLYRYYRYLIDYQEK